MESVSSTGCLEAPTGGAASLARRGESYRRAGQYEEALADLDTALELDPGHPWLVARRASVRMMLAVQLQRKGTRNPFDPAALEARYSPILTDFDRALHSAPNDLWVASQRIEVLRCMKRYADCLS